MKKRKVVAVSGGFDPIHVGHVRMFEQARALGHKLVVIINNDNWLRAKKGYVFMPQSERAELISSLKPVDAVVVTAHSKNPDDMSVANALSALKPDIFANGGDRKAGNTPETEICEDLGIEMVFNVGGGKIQSSSWLLNRYESSKNVR